MENVIVVKSNGSLFTMWNGRSTVDIRNSKVEPSGEVMMSSDFSKAYSAQINRLIMDNDPLLLEIELNIIDDLIPIKILSYETCFYKRQINEVLESIFKKK